MAIVWVYVCFDVYMCFFLSSLYSSLYILSERIVSSADLVQTGLSCWSGYYVIRFRSFAMLKPNLLIMANHFTADTHSGTFQNFKVVGTLPATISQDVIVWSVDGHTFISILNKQDRIIRAALKSCGKAVLQPVVVNRHSNFTGPLRCGDFKHVIAIDDVFSVGF